MSDTKWTSPTGSAIASHETDRATPAASSEMVRESRNRFEDFPKLAAWMLRLANTNCGMNLYEWNEFCRSLNEALTSQTASPEEKWLPIESAPRDGDLVDLWFPFYGGYRVTNCKFQGDGWYSDKFDEEYRAMMWCKIHGDPTHWMPLPKAPASPSETEKGE